MLSSLLCSAISKTYRGPPIEVCLFQCVYSVPLVILIIPVHDHTVRIHTERVRALSVLISGRASALSSNFFFLRLLLFHTNFTKSSSSHYELMK